MNVLLLSVCLVAALDVDHNVKKQIRGSKAAVSFVKALDFKRRLRVCNAYPYAAALDVAKGSEQLTTEEPMSYKTCADFQIELLPGDKLIFKVGEANAGTFSVSDMPNNDAVLLLVISRHDTLSTAVSFESHVYANLLNAQVAVVDTYKGPEKASLKIIDHEDAKTSRMEDLRFDSVVAVNPGKYDCQLVSSEGDVIATEGLVALNRESYILLRVGVKSQQGPSYPEELVVFPKSDASSLHGGAALGSMVVALMVAMW